MLVFPAVYLSPPLAEGTSLRYRLNWGAGGKRIEQAPEYSVFVGDLSPEVTDAELKATFLEKYASVLGAKVVTNPMTGSSKSFGFIRFGDEQERDEALTAMNGAECCGRPIRVAPATKRTSVQGERATQKKAEEASLIFSTYHITRTYSVYARSDPAFFFRS